MPLCLVTRTNVTECVDSLWYLLSVLRALQEGQISLQTLRETVMSAYGERALLVDLSPDVKVRRVAGGRRWRPVSDPLASPQSAPAS